MDDRDYYGNKRLELAGQVGQPCYFFFYFSRDRLSSFDCMTTLAWGLLSLLVSLAFQRKGWREGVNGRDN